MYSQKWPAVSVFHFRRMPLYHIFGHIFCFAGEERTDMRNPDYPYIDLSFYVFHIFQLFHNFLYLSFLYIDVCIYSTFIYSHSYMLQNSLIFSLLFLVFFFGINFIIMLLRLSISFLWDIIYIFHSNLLKFHLGRLDIKNSYLVVLFLFLFF